MKLFELKLRISRERIVRNVLRGGPRLTWMVIITKYRKRRLNEREMKQLTVQGKEWKIFCGALKQPEGKIEVEIEHNKWRSFY